MARFFCIFHALSFELNFFFDQRIPLRKFLPEIVPFWFKNRKKKTDSTRSYERAYVRGGLI